MLVHVILRVLGVNRVGSSLRRDGQDTECIELSVVDISYSSSNGTDDVVITVDFDSDGFLL